MAERHWLAGLAMFTGAYAIGTLARCLDKPLWFDELISFYVSRLPSMAERLPLSLYDGNPPLFHSLTHASMRLIGEVSLGARMPEMIGVWLMCVSLFFFVRRRHPAVYAFLALALPLATLAGDYAYEARPYGIVLGMAGLSLLAWQSLGEGRWRLAWLAALAASLTTGVANHFFGIQILLPVLVGEALRSWERRRVDWGVAAAFGISVAPIVWLIPIARAAVAVEYVRPSGVDHIAASPSVAALAGFYSWLLQPATAPLALAFVVLAVCGLLGVEELESASRPPAPASRAESAALLMYLLVPVWVLIGTALTTDYFQGRYAITAVVGLAGLFPCMLSGWFERRALVPLALTAAVALAWAAHTPVPPMRWAGRAVALAVDSRLYPKQDDLPIVVPDWNSFTQLAHYSPPEVVARLYYLTDLEYSRRRYRPYAESSLYGERTILPGHVVNYGTFVSTHSRFWLYGNAPLGAGSQASRLLAEGWRLECKAQQGVQSLILATRE